MHDHLEEMGRNIVRRLHPDEPMNHSRLWIRGEIEDVLASDLVMEATRAIATNTYSWRRSDVLFSKILTKGFGNMERLRFLHVESETWKHFAKIEVGQNFPSALRFLSWHGYPHRCLPIIFQANNLVALEMPYSRIEEFWEKGERKVLYNLKFLDLSFSKLMTLDCDLFPNLETLNLENCYRLVKLNVPTGSLRRLVYLSLHNCSGFESFLFIKQLKSLQVLDLSYLHLTEFPDILPGHFNYSLLELKFSGNNFQQVPSSIGNLQKLVSLDFSWCGRLESLPPSICSLRRLKNLDLEGCALEELPEDLGLLESLEWLNLRRTRVRHLPFSISMWKHLKTDIPNQTFPKKIGESTVRNGLPRGQTITDLWHSAHIIERQ